MFGSYIPQEVSVVCRYLPHRAKCNMLPDHEIDVGMLEKPETWLGCIRVIFCKFGWSSCKNDASHHSMAAGCDAAYQAYTITRYIRHLLHVCDGTMCSIINRDSGSRWEDWRKLGSCGQ